MVKNFANVERKVQLMAAFTGSALISADVLLGRGGVKLVYHPGHKIEPAVFVTDTFKTDEPAMTALLREACKRGSWTAVRAQDLKGRGRKPSLLLRGEGEVIDSFSKTMVKSFSANNFLRWFTTARLNKEARACVKAIS